MRELEDIVRAAEAVAKDGKRGALATVVQVEGSSYRRPGARMLVLDDGATSGSVSGGCLEADVIREALAIIETGERKLLRYDTTDDDIVFGIGLGCNGIIQVTVEPVDEALLAMLRVVVDSGEDAAIAVRFGAEIGTSFALTSSGSVSSAPIDCEIEKVAHLVMAQRRHAWEDNVFFEFRRAPVQLILFGAGHDAVPLVALASNLGWRVTVVDHRPAYAIASRFPGAQAVIHARPEKVAELVPFGDRTMAVVMSHTYSVDLANFRRLLDTGAQYIGLLGPKSRSTRILADLRDQGLTWPNDRLACVHGPVGLNIGGDTPDAIALSIVAEIQAVVAGRDGGKLRDRNAPIYDAAVVPTGEPA